MRRQDPPLNSGIGVCVGVSRRSHGSFHPQRFAAHRRRSSAALYSMTYGVPRAATI